MSYRKKKKEEKPAMKDESLPEEVPRYSGDHPIHIPAEDRFNRWPFAKRIADTLRDRKDPSCIVVGIYGAWGEGKTSVLNLIESELKSEAKVAVVRFNPWYFRSEAVLIKGLFETLAEGVGKKLASKGEQFGDVLGKLGTFLSLASASVAGGLVSINPGEAVGKIAKELSQADLSDYRERIQEILQEADVRVVVLIDDIDRMERQEIQALFKTVRLSADFERIAYVLAFDRDVVAASLGERYGGGEASQGAAFLEKILQVPLHLPRARKEALRQIVFDGTDAALKLAGIDVSNEKGQTIGNYLVSGLESRLSTPRQAHLFSNALLFALPILKGEVNVVDQILIEGLRIFYPFIYEAIRSNPQHFCDYPSKDKARIILEKVTSSLTSEQQTDVQSLLEYLFPRVSARGYGNEWDTTWAREQRICSPQYFERFFTYGIDKSEVSDIEFDSFLMTMRESAPRESLKLWEDFASPERISAVIDKLRQRLDNIKSRLAENIATAIAATGKNLPRQEDLFFSTFGQAAILVSRLIDGLADLETKATLADSVVSIADPLPFAAEIVRLLGPLDRSGKAVLEEGPLRRIGANLAKRIEEECRAEWVFSKYGRESIGLLWTWKQYASNVQSYVSEGLQRDIGRLDEFLSSFLGQAYSSGLPVRTDFRREGYDNIASIVDPGVVNELVMQAYGDKILPEEYHFGDDTPDDLRIANQFAYIHRHVIAEEAKESGARQVLKENV